MKVQAKDLTEDQKRLIAQNVSGRAFGATGAGDAKTMPNRCASNPPLGDPSAGPAWNGWGSEDIQYTFSSRTRRRPYGGSSAAFETEMGLRISLWRGNL